MTAQDKAASTPAVPIASETAQPPKTEIAATSDTEAGRQVKTDSVVTPTAEPSQKQTPELEEKPAPEANSAPTGKSAPEENSPEEDEGEAEESRRETLVPLPARLPDGQRLRPIGVYESQLPELVPNNYRPVSIDRLNQAFERMADSSTDDRVSRLRSSVYWVRVVDGTLVSDRSVIDIETKEEGILRRSLGRANMAVIQPPRRDSATALARLPRLESDADGSLSVVYRASTNVRSGIEFKWRLQGQNVGLGHNFLLKLPRCPQTRIVLSAPSDLSVESLDGVFRSRPGPPPDAGELLTDSNTRWYEIEAGGLTDTSGMTTVRIRTRRRDLSDDLQTLVVRRESTDYEVDYGGVTWNSRFTVQLPRRRELPPLLVRQGTITSVAIQGNAAPYRVEPVGETFQRVVIDLPEASSTEGSDSIVIAIAGKSSWRGTTGWCDLPMPMWLGDQVVRAASTHDVQLIVPSSLQVLTWELPEGWRQTPSSEEGPGQVFSALGPPIQPPGAVSGELGVKTPAGRNRSRLRLSQQPKIVSAENLLLLDASSGPLQARARLTLDIDTDRVEPLRLQIQPGWSLESLILPESGREVEVSERNNSSRSVTIWPEPSDVIDSKLVIEATGSARPTRNPNEIAAAWFVRIRDSRGVMLSGAIAPAGMNWSGNSALEVERVDASDLTEVQRAFFAAIDDESLLFAVKTGQTPALSLESPGVSFNVDSALQFQLDGDEVIESLLIKTDAASQLLTTLSVQTGQAAGRPPYRWLLRAADDSPPISLPSLDVTLSDEESEGVYRIDLSDRNLRDRTLVGRRRYAIDGDLRVSLPSVPKAASQSSEVHLGAGLVLKENAASVMKVPSDITQTVASNPSYDRDVNGSLARAEPATRLRYDAVKQPSILIAKSGGDPQVTIVWRESVRMIASSRGTDRVEATFDLSAAGPFRIDHDPGLRLVAVFQNGRSLDSVGSLGRPIELQPTAARETVRLVFNRDRLGAGWVRQCRIPRVKASGVIVKSDYRLIASSDTFVPVAVIQAPASSTDRSIMVSAGDRVTLTRRNIALAMGWLLAAIIFSISWYVSRRSPVAITAVIILMVTAACLWWPWHLAIVGWLVVPAASAALLVAATSWTDHGSQLLEFDFDEAVDETRSRSALRPDSSIASVGRSRRTVGRALILLLLVGGGIVTVLQAQDSGGLVARNSGPTDAVNVLVPIDKQGGFSGDVVYVPLTFKSALFPPRAMALPQDARIQSADYRVRIVTEREGGESSTPIVEADFLIHVDDPDRANGLVRLPIAANWVRQVQRVGELNRIVQVTPDASGKLVARLPKGDAFHLRLTLDPAISESPQWEKMFLSIPVVAASRLTVEAERSLAALRVGGSSGRLLDEQELGTWVEEIGPVDSLEVEFRRPERVAATDSQPLQRRYWIHASKRQATIDCEVDPPFDVSLGKIVQLVVRDARLPRVTTPAWILRGSELVSPTRRLVTLESLEDKPGPIRFLWSERIELADDRQLPAFPLTVPEVILPALGENAEAWIAIDSDPDVSVAATDREMTEPLSVDHFMTAWTGYRRRQPERAFIAVGRFPELELRGEPTTDPTVKQSHHLHVANSQLRLRYTATLSPGDLGSTPRTLKIPNNLQLIEIKVDGRNVMARATRSGRSSEIPLPGAIENAPSTIDVIAVVPIQSGNRQFQLPQLEILPRVSTADSYSLSRASDVAVQNVSPTAIESENDMPTVTADALVHGWIPIATWQFESQADSGGSRRIGGRFRVTPLQHRFDCDQMIALSRADGQWDMQTWLRFDSGRIPDFVDVEVPTRWCDYLDVSPSTVWSQQPAVDPSLQIVRIRCDQASLGDGVLTIRGRLDDAGLGRVAVPDVKVLGHGRRRIEIAVPNRLTNESISWRTSAVESKNLSDGWAELLSDTGPRSTYVVANPDWSVELAPPPQIDTVAVALSSDVRVYAKSDSALIAVRWDLLPGGLDWVDVRLPEGASCLGAWTAGRAVIARPAQSNEPDEDDATGNRVRVPLSLSRLAQPVELLIRVPIGPLRQADYLPELIDIPVSQSWLAIYRPDGPSDGADTSRLQGESERALALAESIVDAVDQSIDSLAELPGEEVAIWLAPWVERYRQISRAVEHEPNFTPPTALATADDATPREPTLDVSEEARWARLDARLSVQTQQHLADQPAVGPRSSLHEFGGYRLRRVSRVLANSPASPVQPASTHRQSLRTMIVNFLTLALVAGLLACLWPARRYVEGILVHPAFWLAVIGILGFVVAPIPVAAAIVLAAVTLPAFPALPRRRSE